MKNIKFKLIWSLLLTLLFSANLYAINISVSNPVISPDPIMASSNYTVSFDINNLSATTTPEDAVFVVASLSGYNASNVAGLVSNTVGWNCVDDTVNTGRVNCDRSFSIGEFPAGSSLNLAITLVAGSLAVNPDTFNIDSTDESGLMEDNLSDNSTSASTTGGASTDLELLKFAKDGVGGSIIADIPIDTQFVYSIQVNNLSTVAATNVLVTDNIPAGIEITSAAQSTGSWSCSIAPFVDNLTSQLVTCSHPTISASQPNFAEVIYLDAFGRVSSPNAITNTASVSADEIDSNTGNNTDVASISINPAPLPVDVLVTKTFDSGFVFEDFGVTVVQGQQATYKVLADATSGTASNVVLTDVLPTGITYVSHQIIGPNFTCAFDGVNKVSCTASNLPVTAAEDGFFVTVAADGVLGSLVDNTASISADVGSNSDSSNDTSTPGPFIIVAPGVELDLTITKDAQLAGSSISNNNFVIGQSFEYKLVAINQNSNVAQAGDVSIFDGLPTGIDLDAVPTSSGWDCSGTSGAIVDCINTIPIAANGGTLELIVPVSSQIANTYSNTAFVDVPTSSSAFENNTSDNSANFAITIVNNLNPTTLGISKNSLVSGSIVTSVNSGSNYTYRINVNNTGNADAINIVAIDNLPTGVNVNTTSGSGWNCVNSGAQYTCTFPGPLTPGSSTFFDLNVTEATAAGVVQILNTVDVSADNSVLQTASNSISVIRPELSVSLSQNPDPIEENSPFDLIVTIANTGNIDLNSILVDNFLPSGFSYGATAKAAAPSCSQNGTIMSCFFANPIAPGTTEILTIPILAINPVVSGATYVNTTNISGAGINNPITQTTSFNVIPAAVVGYDVSLLKTASSTTVAPGDALSYLLSVSNLGTQDVTGLQVDDILPTGVQLVSINAPDWSCSGTTQVVCLQNSLVSGMTSDIIINVKAPSVDGNLSNSAQVSINEVDANTNNNTSQVNVDVQTGFVGQPAVADLQLTKTTSTTTIISGEQYSWQVEVFNNGPDAASNVVVNDLFPVGYVFDSVITSDGTCQATSADLTCQIPVLFNQDSVLIEVLGTASIDSGELSSTATVTADSNDPVPDNNSGSVSIIVDPVPFFEVDLAVNIDAVEAIDQGASSDFSINVTNNGPDTANPPDLEISVTGLLDSVAFNSGSDWSCQEAGFVVSCHFNGTVMNNGQVSSVGLTVNTTEVVLEAQDVMVTAMVSTTETDVDSTLDNNTATSVIGVAGTPTEGEIGDALRDVIGSSGDPVLDSAIDAVAGYCEIEYFTALESLCDDLYNSALSGDRDEINRFLREITPNEVIGQSTSINEIAQAQFRNIGARLNQLRGGGGSGFSSAGLNARYGNGSIPLAMLAYLNKTEEESKRIDTNNDFISPWGFFVNGTISMGKRDATGRELGFDFDTFGLTAGLDYRIDSKKVVGIAVGYANFDSKIEGSSKLNSTGLTLTGYGSFYVNDNFYVDARISLGKPKFEQTRRVDFTLGDTRFNQTAAGDTNANQYSVSMSAGYSFYKNAWNITPNTSFTYTSTNIDSFTESGAGDFNIEYLEQNLESLIWSAGIRVSKAVSLKKGVITPQFDFDYNYQGLNDDSTVEARFINAPIDQMFILQTDSPDRSYGSAGLGLVYISANGKQAYFNYRSVLGLEGFSRGTFNVGARFEF